MTETAPFVQTVTGPVAPEELGVTMPHEHVFVLNPSFVEPQEASERFRAHEPVSESNIEWIRQYWTSNVDNLQLYDEEVAIEEMGRYYRAGGDAIVDATTRWIARDPRALFRVSRATGVKIVAGTGFYVAETHPGDMDRRSDADLAAEMIHELTEGIDDTGVKAGLIGEMGCYWPLREAERKALRAAAIASLETNAAVMVHPGRDPAAPPRASTCSPPSAWTRARSSSPTSTGPSWSQRRSWTSPRPASTSSTTSLARRPPCSPPWA